jgi:hypothetical protein
MGTRRHRRWVFFVLAAVVVLPALATAHAPEGQAGAPAPFDPELFTGWQTWVHLSVQWGHLLGLPFWLGILLAAWVFRVLALEPLLFAGWAVLLMQGSAAPTTWNTALAFPRPRVCCSGPWSEPMTSASLTPRCSA